jgi:SAM-dependent methyltransferase
LDLEEREELVRQRAPGIADQILNAAREAANEAEFRKPVGRVFEDFAEQVGVQLRAHEEYTLANGRADTVYNRLVIEYERPGSLREYNKYGHNIHAIGQAKTYIEDVAKKEHLKQHRMAGVVLDGLYIIFVRHFHETWIIEDPVEVNAHSIERFLRLLVSLSSGAALIPQNLINDFGSNTLTAQRSTRALYSALASTESELVLKLFEQWKTFFSQVSGYEERSARLAQRKELRAFARGMGVDPDEADPPTLFFSVHTYFAILIKLLAWLAVSRYGFRFGTSFARLVSLPSEELWSELQKMERGGIFREYGIRNFLEGDFFGWYLRIWDGSIDQAVRSVLQRLSDYNPTTLEVGPEQTRDLLKKLYQELMPRDIRHDLGEYYTPDWLAQRLLVQLDHRLFEALPPPGRDRDRVLKYARQVLLKKRFLDPACGSGTFLVLIVQKIKELAQHLMLSEQDVLNAILSNVVGIDLNPLAVIASRTNYLLALGGLLEHRQGDIDIPVYLADSILTPLMGSGLFEAGKYPVKTTVGVFEVPEQLATRERIDALANVLDESIEASAPADVVCKRVKAQARLSDQEYEHALPTLQRLYDQLRGLHAQGLDGIWARIVKNAFAPIFLERFDYVAGNPPWVNWESLPDQYRQDTKPLWVHHGLFPHSGMDSILGKGKKDISMLMCYVAMDKYLAGSGKLGFVITQSVFKTAGAGQGFRRFQLGSGAPIRVLHVDDLVQIAPFERVGNRTNVVVLQKGQANRYPVPYTYWRRAVRGKSVSVDATLQEAMDLTSRANFDAQPVEEGDPSSPWMTGRPGALKAVKKVLGASEYRAHAGAYTGGANAVYWMEIVGTRPDGLMVISNVTEGAKRAVDSVRAAIEPDLLYPLLRGRDVQRWQAVPSAHILMVQDPDTRTGIPEEVMSLQYPKTYAYLKRFEDILARRQSQAVRRLAERGAFYSIFAVGEYTFAPYKVAWTRVAKDIAGAVVGQARVHGVEVPVVPAETAVLVPFEEEGEAHYFCAALNSMAWRFVIVSTAVHGTGGFGSPNVLDKARIPRYQRENKVHVRLATLSRDAHQAAASGDGARLQRVEGEIDELAAQLWSLAPRELSEIKEGLTDLL